jgi:GT2 family glycosyltransferase
MTKFRPDVAICVVNWNTPGDLENLLASAWRIEGPIKMSIYQNHHGMIDSTPALDRIHERYPDHVITQGDDQNRGHGYGIKRAASAAYFAWDPEFLFLLNPDCLFVENVIDKLLEVLTRRPENFAVGPKQTTRAGKLTAAGIVGIGQNPIPRHWMERDRGQANDVVSGPMVSGSAIMMRSKDFFAYDGLLESRHYYSETWPCYHAAAHGRENWYVGTAKMIHEWHQSSPVGSPLTDGMMAEDRELFRRLCDEHDPPIPRD